MMPNEGRLINHAWNSFLQKPNHPHLVTDLQLLQHHQSGEWLDGYDTAAKLGIHIRRLSGMKMSGHLEMQMNIDGGPDFRITEKGLDNLYPFVRLPDLNDRVSTPNFR